ncbi:MAG: hypothetical protein P4L84_04995 [Isosphaeraceae bacterium]|nr:hypothetical protein [Isosphaeraceae bacterium]
MNDARRLLLERYFDGELAAAEQDELRRDLADDPAALRHLDQLALLRTLARAHDPSVQPALAAPKTAVVQPAWRFAIPIALAAAASLVLMLTAPGERPAGRGLAPSVAALPKSSAVVEARPAALRSRAANPLEVELIRLANTPSRRPERAARAVLSRGSPLQRRPAAREILALELANGAVRAALTRPRRAVPSASAVPSQGRRHPNVQRAHATSSPRA